uniref:Uncharacterized protein n=1 Tax=Glossina brevipalpis TaxID=37001 RepID=A0A1A9WCJ2_9MUSC
MFVEVPTIVPFKCCWGFIPMKVIIAPVQAETTCCKGRIRNRGSSNSNLGFLRGFTPPNSVFCKFINFELLRAGWFVTSAASLLSLPIIYNISYVAFAFASLLHPLVLLIDTFVKILLNNICSTLTYYGGYNSSEIPSATSSPN